MTTSILNSNNKFIDHITLLIKEFAKGCKENPELVKKELKSIQREAPFQLKPQELLNLLNKKGIFVEQDNLEDFLLAAAVIQIKTLDGQAQLIKQFVQNYFSKNATPLNFVTMSSHFFIEFMANSSNFASEQQRQFYFMSLSNEASGFKKQI